MAQLDPNFPKMTLSDIPRLLPSLPIEIKSPKFIHKPFMPPEATYYTNWKPLPIRVCVICDQGANNYSTPLNGKAICKECFNKLTDPIG